VEAHRQTLRNSFVHREIQAVVIRMSKPCPSGDIVEAREGRPLEVRANVVTGAARRDRTQVGRSEGPAGSDRQPVEVIARRLVERVIELVTNIDNRSLTKVVLNVKAGILRS